MDEEAVFLADTTKFCKKTCNDSWNICPYYKTNFLYEFEIPAFQEMLPRHVEIIVWSQPGKELLDEEI